jgi:hypothetical protein
MKIIINHNNQQYSIEYSFDNKWIEIKNKIIKLLNLNIDYIDLEFINDRPIREFGKQALILGLLERIYDDYYISDFITKARDLYFNILFVSLTKEEKREVIKIKQKNCLFNDIDFPPLSIK